MGYLSEDEHNTDWLAALADDARKVELVIDRVEALGCLALEDIKKQDYRAAILKLAQMGEGMRLVRETLGLK